MSSTDHTVFSAAAGGFSTLQASAISNLDAVFKATEKGGPVTIDSDIQFTSGSLYAQGYLRFSLGDDAQPGDQFKLPSAEDPDAAGAISVDGNDVYLGNGTGRERIGSIDVEENGQNGQPLKILFSMPLPNSGFEDGEAGWNISKEQYGNDPDEIDFHNYNQIKLAFDNATGSGTVKIGDIDESRDKFTFSGSIKAGEGVGGSNALYLSSDGRISGYGDGDKNDHENDGNGSMHGPYATSVDSITVAEGDSLVLQFNAIAETDDYEVFGLLRKVDANGNFLDSSLDSGNNIVLFAERGATTNGFKEVTTKNLPAGDYKFEFVGGTYDGTGAYALGSHLYVDNIRLVPGQDITDTLVSKIAQQVTYESTADDAPTERTVTIEAADADGPVASGDITLEISHVNNPPSLSGDGLLAAVDEDTAAPEGDTVQNLFGSKFSDLDADVEAGQVKGDSFAGIAIVGDASTPDQGTWQFSVDGGTGWANISEANVSTSTALLLDTDALLRFVPSPNWNGTPGALSVHAVDDSYAGDFSAPAAESQITVEYFDTTTDGADSPVSADPVELETEVDPVNDAPVFSTESITHDVNGAMSGPITGTVEASDEHDDAPNEGGTLVYGVQGGTVADGVSTLVGKYGTLEIDTATGEYTYTPDPSKVGPLHIGVSDQDTFTLTVTDGTTPATLPLTVDVTGLNDPPSGTDGTVSVDEDASYVVKAADFGFTDTVDGTADAFVSVKISTLPTAGTLTLDGNAVAEGDFIDVLDIDAGKLVFTPAGDLNGDGYASLTFQVRDGGGTQDGGVDLDPTPRTLTIDVTPVNDAPVLVAPGTAPILPTISEDASAEEIPAIVVGDLFGPEGSNKVVFSDVDAITQGDGENWDGGIAIHGLNSSDPLVDGSWQYKLGDGVWQDVGEIGETDALLLGSTDSLRFVPNGDNGGTPSISYYLWDGSAGTAGTKVDASGRGANTPFSSDGVTGSQTVTHANDAPVLDLNGAEAGQDYAVKFLPRGEAVGIVADDMSISDVDQFNGTFDYITGAKVKLAEGALDNLFGDIFEQISARDADGNVITQYGNISIRSNPDGTELTLSGEGSWAQYQEALKTIQYLNANPNAANGPRKIEISVTDGAHGKDGEHSTTTAITTVNVGWSSVVDLNGVGEGRDYATQFVEDGGNIAIAASTASLDNQAVKVTTLTVSLTNPLNGEKEKLSINLDDLASRVPGVEVKAGNGGHEIVLSTIDPAGITAETMQLALRMVNYNNASQNPDTTQRVVKVTVEDVNGTGISANTTIGITSVNDAPVFSGAHVATVTEGGVSNFKGVLQSTDADNDADDILYVVTSSPDNGVVFRELPDGTREVIDVVVTEPLTADQIEALKDGKGYFTQAEVDAGVIKYKHDGSDTALDGFDFKLVDREADYADELAKEALHLEYGVTPVDDVVQIVGQLKVGETLSADIGGIDDLGDPANLGYQWLIDGTPVGTDDTYVLTEDDAGKTITLKVTYDSAAGDQKEAESQASAPIAEDNGGPDFVSAAVDGATLTLTYDDAEDDDLSAETARPDQFVVKVDGKEVLVTGVSVDEDARTVTLTLEPAVAKGQAVTVSYVDPSTTDDEQAIQDANGNDAASLLNLDVSNQTGDTGSNPDPEPNPNPNPNPGPQPEPGLPEGAIVDGKTTTVTGNDGTVTKTTTGTLGGSPVTETVVTSPDGRVHYELAYQAAGKGGAVLPLLYEANLGHEYNTWARLPAGVSLTSTGIRTPRADNGEADLIQLIRETVAGADSLLPTMVSGGQSFLDGRPDTATLWVNKVTLAASDDTTQPSGPIVIDGPSFVSSGVNPGAKLEALVIDGSKLPEGSVLELQNIDFAVVVGDGLVVQGGDGANILYGDAGAQTFRMGDDDDLIHAGAGNDTVDGGAGDDHLFGNEGDDILIGGTGDDLIHGGLNRDEAQFSGKQDAYEITRDHGLTIVRSLADPENVTTLVNVETLRFDDSEYTVKNEVFHTQIATLYYQVLDRQAEVDGFQFWSHAHAEGRPIGDVALSMLHSSEFTGINGTAFADLGLSDQVEGFYLHFLDRKAEDAGHAFWMEQLENGMTLSEVAGHFVESREMQEEHYLQAEGWDFFL